MDACDRLRSGGITPPGEPPLLPLGLDAITSDSPHELRRALSRAREALALAA